MSFRACFLLVLIPAAGWPDSAKLSPREEARPAPELDALFQRADGWIGGDGAYSVALGKDRTLWLFSDTWVGKVREGKRADASIVNNSLGVQEGSGAATKVRFLFGKGEAGKPAAWLTPADGRGWFWLQAGVLVNHKLYVFLAQIEKADRPGVFGFRQVGQWLGIVANPNDEPENWRLQQKKLPFVEFSKKHTLNFGTAVLQESGYLYVYGFQETGKFGALGRRMVLARVEADKIEDFADWRFFDEGEWHKDAGRVTGLAGGFAPECSVSYLPKQRLYAAVYTELGLSPRILARTAPAPWGPWSEPVRLYKCPEPARDKRLFCYAAKAHPTLAAGDELVISYVVNSTDFWQVAADARLYWPRFVRVKLK